MDTNTPERPVRICRKCSVRSDTDGEFCSNCGTPYIRKSRKPSRKVAIVTLAAVLLLAGAATGIAVKRTNDASARDRTTAAAEQAAEREAKRLADLQVATDEAERKSRSALVKELEKNVSKYAKKLVKEDLLDGPIKYASCTATGGGSTDDLTSLTGTFECLAVNKENDDGTSSGYAFAGTTEWATGEMTWKLGN